MRLTPLEFYKLRRNLVLKGKLEVLLWRKECMLLWTTNKYLPIMSMLFLHLTVSSFSSQAYENWVQVLVKMIKQVNAVYTPPPMTTSKLKLNYRTINLENHLTTIWTEVPWLGKAAWEWKKGRDTKLVGGWESGGTSQLQRSLRSEGSYPHTGFVGQDSSIRKRSPHNVWLWLWQPARISSIWMRWKAAGEQGTLFFL